MSELLPCPMCGAAAAFKKVAKPAWDQDPHPDEGGEYIECTNNACAARSMMIFPTIRDAKPFLIEKWNRRSTPASSSIDSSPAYNKPIGGPTAEDYRAAGNELAQALIDRTMLSLHDGWSDYGEWLVKRSQAIARQRGEEK